MKKLFIIMAIFIFAFGMNSCGKAKSGVSKQDVAESTQNKTEQADESQNQTVEGAELRAYQMYNDVMKSLYPNERDNDSYLNQKYLSTGYKKILDKYNQSGEHERLQWWTANGESEIIGYCYAIDNVKLVSKDKAVVDLRIFEISDTETLEHMENKVTVTLVYERGNWYADDFKRANYDNSDRVWLAR